jgi:hypothetical protein
MMILVEVNAVMYLECSPGSYLKALLARLLLYP